MTFVVASALAASAQAESNEELAIQLSNPVAALISVPFQFNYDQDIGSARNGTRNRLNIQPVVPFDLNAEWNVISRTIVPVVWQDNIFPGAGPVFPLPTGSNNLLTADKWGAGPTGVVIRQQGPWTVRALANHIWSFAGNSSRADVNATFLQPFVTYTARTATTFSLQAESTYDWNGRQWAVTADKAVGKLSIAANRSPSCPSRFSHRQPFSIKS